MAKKEKLLEELRNCGRKPVKYENTATPAQEHQRVLANKFMRPKCRGKLTSSQIKELEAIWASNSGDKHSVVTKSVAQGSSEGGRGIKRQCEEGRAEPNSVIVMQNQRMAHASSGDRPLAKRPSQEECAHMPPHKRMRWKPYLPESDFPIWEFVRKFNRVPKGSWRTSGIRM